MALLLSQLVELDQDQLGKLSIIHRIDPVSTLAAQSWLRVDGIAVSSGSRVSCGIRTLGREVRRRSRSLV